MRQHYFLLSLLIFLILNQACKNNQGDLKQSLIGNWELSKNYNELTKTSRVFASGNGNILVFTDSSYKQFSNGSMTSMGKYKIIEGLDNSSGIISSRIIFEPEIYKWGSIRYLTGIKQSQLFIKADTIGASTNFYHRLK